MFDNKKIFILGMARSGYEVAKLLATKNCDILITDQKEQDKEKVEELKSLGIDVIITKNQEDLLDNSFDYVIKNPGIHIDVPPVLKAKKLNIPVINEAEVAYHYLPENVKIIGITGSNGKTTTTTLIYEVLKEANLPVHLGGNIGLPFSSLIDKIKERDILVIELSAQQLHDFNHFKTDISVLTNLIETHMEYFFTLENYMNSKKRIFKFHNKENLAIINYSDEYSMKITEDIASDKIYFSSKEKTDLYIKTDSIYYKEEQIIKLDDIKLKGTHNYENSMCAIAIAKEFNVDNEIITKVLSDFSGVEHRIEYVNDVQGREFYNDSKSTNIKATSIALGTFSKPTVLLLGGLDRQIVFNDLIPFMEHVKLIVGYGECKDSIKNFAITNNFKCEITETLEEATKLAYKLSKKGDIILLSPACASWDQFADFEERGNKFKEVINKL